MYRTTTRESSCSSIVHPTMVSLSPSSKTLTQVTAKVYHAKFGGVGEDWQYFNQRGTVVFGQDQIPEEQDTTVQSKPAVEADGVAVIPEPKGDSDAHYWFRLRDESSGRIVWMFQVPEDCVYRIDKPFFHVFNGKSRMWGFLFDNDQDGAAFGQVVQAHLPTSLNNSQQLKLYSSFGSSKRDPSVRSKKSTKSKISRTNTNLNSSNASTPTIISITATVSENRPPQQQQQQQQFVKLKGITPSMISLPKTQSFVHVGHIGLNNDGVIECSEGIDPSWLTIIRSLSTVSGRV
ncbi:hypothetical protein BT96DRAFT_875535 [Gymnopus androsaceus JB14]|uniref:WH1 domain-containing protein n=1 Tax=Gymnopus androsaceus JB14 TaxID=1447944 RepID=A0A6A4I3X5_9AGAR|nr:hypothetical protein BT96DRAFT_875535 [Gymnopus androsaceus JB14]